MTQRRLGWGIGLAVTTIGLLVSRAGAGAGEIAPPVAMQDVEAPQVETPSRSVAHDPEGFRIIPRAAVMFGQADGFVQTPSGGQPGTSSAGRPTLKELGIDDAQILDVSLTLAWDDHEISASGQWMDLTGRAVLEEPLLSQAQLFPAGSRVGAEVSADWYTIAYGHRFTHDLGEPGDQAITFTPSGGVAIFDIDYELRGEGGAGAHREYIKPSPMFGLAIDWHATDRLAVSASVRAAVPISSGASLLAAQVEARYRFVQGRTGSLDGVIGVGYEHIDYDDARKQEIPNHVDVELGPLLLVGLRAQF